MKVAHFRLRHTVYMRSQQSSVYNGNDNELDITYVQFPSSMSTHSISDKNMET